MTTFAARTELAAYLDASAIVKLIKEEPESAAIASFAQSRQLVTSELAIAEVPRAVYRGAADSPAEERDRLLAEADRALDELDLVQLDRVVLALAGSFEEPRLRSLDAIHIATALVVASEIECFVSYDRRQAGAATAAGFPLAQPGR